MTLLYESPNALCRITHTESIRGWMAGDIFDAQLAMALIGSFLLVFF